MAHELPAVPTARVRVGSGPRDGLTISRVQLRDRRTTDAPPCRWVLQRQLEILLYHRSDGGTTGSIGKLIDELGPEFKETPLRVTKAAVVDQHVTEREYAELKALYTQTCTDGLGTPGRIRHVTLLPMATAAAVVQRYGRSERTVAFLRAFELPVPEVWSLQEAQEEGTAAGEVDLLLDDRLHELTFEAEDTSFAEELTDMASFTVDAEDDTKMRSYTLERVPAALERELAAYLTHRTATFAARRSGGAVVSDTASKHKEHLLRFYGWMVRTQQLPEGATLNLSLLGGADLGDSAQAYVEWLEARSLRFSSIANYLNGLVALTSYVYHTFDPPDATLALDPTPLTQLINLRDQAEKASTTQQMYDKRTGGGWLTWGEVQQVRVKATAALDAAVQGSAPARRQLLKDAAALSMLSLLPPDRVGVIRKLRFEL